MKSIYINGHTFHHGDHVTAVLNTQEVDAKFCDDYVRRTLYTVTVHGVLYVEDDTTCYVCQDAKSGNNSYSEVFGKAYSWYIRVYDGKIAGSDTKRIIPRYKTEPKKDEVSELDIVPVNLDDDDPMPDDWQLPYPIPEYL
jgi:hypothetical protein